MVIMNFKEIKCQVVPKNLFSVGAYISNRYTKLENI